MMMAPVAKSCYITKIERRENALFLTSERGKLRIVFKSENCVRITYTDREEFESEDNPGILNTSVYDGWTYEEISSQNGSFEKAHQVIKVKCGKLILLIDRESAAITYCDATGKVLLKERTKDCRELERFLTYKIADDGSAKVEKIVTPDGEKEVIKEAVRIQDEELYHTRLHVEFQDGEALYGLGQQEEGFGNLRGRAVYLYQANRKIAIPMLVSSLGYGILMDTYSPMIFRDDLYDSGFYTQADRELDYYVINGEGIDGVIREYRKLTGKAVMLPRWAFGYIQSKERYESQDEVLDVAKEFKDRGIGLDGIVVDWMSWPDGLWGQKTFDPIRFSDPQMMTDKLHEMSVHFMISIWPNMDEKCPDHKAFKDKNLLLPMSNVYNALSEEARDLYWQQVNENYFSKGVDAWWCDSSEPYTPEWNHLICPDVATQFHEFIKDASDHLPARLCNAYGFYHAKTLYDGQRKTMGEKEKRVVNLTRSAYTGQQRFGTILWSGDIEASWRTLNRQVAAGLHFCMSGLPYWTVDIGAFFVKDSVQWFWKGDYPDTVSDPGYAELFARWYQWACFLPVFRGHGTDVSRELWQFGEQGEPIYDALVATNRLRYRLMPYIYTLAGLTWLEDASIMRHLVMEYPEDEQVRDIFDEFLFGHDLLICPVLQSCISSRKVYLPKGNAWYDYCNKERFEGGQWIEVSISIDRIPIFVREGTILPLSDVTDRASSQVDYFEIYGNGPAKGSWYDDAGDGYGYEKGDLALYEIFAEAGSDRLQICRLQGQRTDVSKELLKVPVRRI